MTGRRTGRITVQSLDGADVFELPTSLIECNSIPNERSEIPTPEVASHYPHLKRITNHIPPLVPCVNIQLLIGRDTAEIHHVHEQIVGPKGTPFAQNLSLSWAIIGVCLGKVHQPEVIHVNKTHTLVEGRESIFQPCEKN